MPLSKDLREFVELLNSNEVEYLVVGAFAVAFYGIPRYTGDLDLFVRPDARNAARLLQVLAQFGFGNLDIGIQDLQTPDKVIQLGVAPNRIDLITSLSGVSFDEAWSARTQSNLEGVTTQFIGIAALIRNKEHTGRARDLEDARELRKRATNPK